MNSKLILIVDDEENILRLLEKYLIAAGYRVLKAVTGAEGVLLAQSAKPDLILMDVMLPDMNGAEAVKDIREKKTTQDIPVIFLTAMITKTEELKRKMNVNVDSETYLTIAKPIDPQELLATISEILN